MKEVSDSPLLGNEPTHGGTQRIYMETNGNLNTKPEDNTAEKAIQEGRVKTEQEQFADKHKISVKEDPQQPETPSNQGEEKTYANKYKSVEELEKAYEELQKKLGKSNEETSETQVEQEEVAKAVDNISPELWNLGNEEFTNTGDVSDETVAKFVKAGIPEEYVRTYVEGVKAQMELMTTQLHTQLGGEERMTQIANWGAENLSEAEIETYNEMIESGEVNKILTAYQSIEARMSQKTGNKFIQPTSTGNDDAYAFQSRAQMIQAMSDPRYAKDPAYRDEVTRKIARSKVL